MKNGVVQSSTFRMSGKIPGKCARMSVKSTHRDQYWKLRLC